MVMKGSARWPVTWSASFARGFVAVSASTISLGPRKPCRPSSWRWSRQSVRSAKSVCPWCVYSYGPKGATAVKPSCNAGPERKREPPCKPTKSLWSMLASAWPPCSPEACHALWRGWRATLRPGATSCPPLQAGGVAPALGSGCVPCPAPTQGGRLPPRSQIPPPSGWALGGPSRPRFWDNLVLSTAQPGAPVLRCAVIHDLRYQEPWVLATNLSVSAYALWCLYRDR